MRRICPLACTCVSASWQQVQCDQLPQVTAAKPPLPGRTVLANSYFCQVFYHSNEKLTIASTDRVYVHRQAESLPTNALSYTTVPMLYMRALQRLVRGTQFIQPPGQEVYRHATTLLPLENTSCYLHPNPKALFPGCLVFISLKNPNLPHIIVVIYVTDSCLLSPVYNYWNHWLTNEFILMELCNTYMNKGLETLSLGKRLIKSH